MLPLHGLWKNQRRWKDARVEPTEAPTLLLTPPQCVKCLLHTEGGAVYGTVLNLGFWSQAQVDSDSGVT